jgi:predicted phosphate transport protein (TIGR00153 family)
MKAWLQKLRARLGRIREAFRRKPNRFLQHLGEQAQIVVQGTEALVGYMTKPSKKNAARVRALEKNADEIRRILIDDLNRSFVTPIDREDLFALSRAVDDILDYAYSTTHEMDILGVAPNDHLRAMAALLHQSAEELHLAIERLEKHPKIATDHSMRVKSIENQMERLYAEALAHLFDEPKDLKHVITMFKLREIYRHMFHAVGSTEQAADIVSDIVIKFY